MVGGVYFWRCLMTKPHLFNYVNEIVEFFDQKNLSPQHFKIFQQFRDRIFDETIAAEQTENAIHEFSYLLFTTALRLRIKDKGINRLLSLHKQFLMEMLEEHFQGKIPRANMQQSVDQHCCILLAAMDSLKKSADYGFFRFAYNCSYSGILAVLRDRVVSSPQ